MPKSKKVRASSNGGIATAERSVGALQAEIEARLPDPRDLDPVRIRQAVTEAARAAGFDQPPRVRLHLESRYAGAWEPAIRIEIEL